MKDSIITSAQRAEVKLAEAEFMLRGERRALAAARRLNLALVLGVVLLGAVAWAAW